MRVSRLIFTLLLTLALFPWGAYASVMGAAVQSPSYKQQSAALPVAPDAAPVVQSVSLCHGHAVHGSACSPLTALLPADIELPVHLRHLIRAEAAAFWPEGPSRQPMLAPPRERADFL